MSLHIDKLPPKIHASGVQWVVLDTDKHPQARRQFVAPMKEAAVHFAKTYHDTHVTKRLYREPTSPIVCVEWEHVNP
jgi:hypothetical protein